MNEKFALMTEKEKKIEQLVVKFLMLLAEENPKIKKKFYELVKKENALDLFR